MYNILVISNFKKYTFCQYLIQETESVLAENTKTETAPQYSGDDGLPQGGGKICKALHQYSKGKISSENMDVIMEIGHGCMVTRNYFYQRYGASKVL